MISDTIAAIATPLGTGGVGIIRMSGPEALAIAQILFRDRDHEALDPPLDQRPSKQFLHGWIVDPPSGIPLDEVVLLVWRAPHSYTTEDVVEIQCHAGIAVMQALLERCLSQGARLAAAGEFTKRAFLGGRLDLTQAEAICDLTSARTERSLAHAVNQLDGALAQAVRRLREPVKHLLARLEAHIDFPDEIDEVPAREIIETIARLDDEIAGMLDTSDQGRILREGVSLAIVGRPNVGKSSLLNALLRSERAIVTDIPGTTRDVLEESLSIRGILFRVLDTAGIRTEADTVEAIGIERSRRAMQEADLRLVVVDGSRAMETEDREILSQAASKPSLVVANKADQVVDLHAMLERLRPDVMGLPIVAISAKYHKGFADLEQALLELAEVSEAPVAGIAINARHKAALQQAQASLERARDSAAREMPADFVAIDLREALAHLGELTGEELTEEIIDHIFSSFCVGK